MEPFKIHILGCGSALPTLKHNASSQLIEMRGKCYMIDCGEGAQMQFRRSHIHFSKLNAIFITHMHGDHCFGLMGLLSTLGMLGRTSNLRVYAPKDYATLFKQQIEFFMQTMEYEMEMIPVDTTNILFICGGAFDGLDKIIESRTDRSAIGFDSPVESRKKRDLGKLFARVEPEDLWKFGTVS